MKEFKKGDEIVAIKDCCSGNFKTGDKGIIDDLEDTPMPIVKWDKSGIFCDSHNYEIELINGDKKECTVKDIELVEEIDGVCVGDIWKDAKASYKVVAIFEDDDDDMMALFINLENRCKVNELTVGDFKDGQTLVKRHGELVKQWRIPTDADAVKRVKSRAKDKYIGQWVYGTLVYANEEKNIYTLIGVKNKPYPVSYNQCEVEVVK